MAAVADDRDNYFHVLLVIRENALESVAQVVEVGLLGDARLEDPRFHRRGGQRARQVLINAHVSLSLGAEEVA